MRLDRPLTLRLGDCIEVMRRLPDDSVDAIVTDPPYGLGFMGKKWDTLPPSKEWAAECLRVLKPGGHLLAFGGTRTYHRLAVAVEDAGFEIRDSIAWLYGSGFPKSRDVSKAIDKAAGAAREVLGPQVYADGTRGHWSAADTYAQDGHTKALDGVGKVLTAPATTDAEKWQGWGTALKPAFEPIVVARKPFPGNVAANVLQHGTGALNVDGCRVQSDSPPGSTLSGATVLGVMNDDGWIPTPTPFEAHAAGRWPTNVVMDEGQAEALDQQTGTLTSGSRRAGTHGLMGYHGAEPAPMPPVTGDSGGASRFFPTFRYQAKAPTSERPRTADGAAHPTVKPVALMRWLVRLVTPPGGLVLDPFLGSGTTAQACLLEGFRCLGIDDDPVSMELTRIRLGLT